MNGTERSTAGNSPHAADPTPRSTAGPSQTGHAQTYTTVNIHVSAGVKLASTIHPAESRVTVDLGDSTTLYFSAADLARFREYLSGVAAALADATVPVPA